jgi:hypothetical protein
VVIFTEYRDTLLHVRDRVFSDAAVIHGGLSRPERRAALDAFGRDGRAVLMATDAAGEGLNLQRTCRVVINLEMPWNPMRLEQRIGRVDRIGQRRTVHAIHLVAASSRELAVVERLSRRMSRARSDIGVPDPLGTFTEPTDVAVPGVRIDATLEHQRLVDSRRLAGTFPVQHEASAAEADSLITAARTAVRARLGAQPLAVLRAVLTDGEGHPVAQHVSGVLVSLRRGPGRGSRVEMQALLDAIAASYECQPSVNPDSWTASAAALHTAFWTRRIERERSIRQFLTERIDLPHQPALFWKRESPGDPAAATSGGAIPDTSASLLSPERSRLIMPASTAVSLLLIP